MKMVEAIILPQNLEAVKAALGEVEVFRMTVSEAQGFGQTRDHDARRPDADYTLSTLRKLKIEIAVNDDFVEATVRAIIRAGGGTGTTDAATGGGKVFILPLDDVVRIRTGERGPEAV